MIVYVKYHSINYIILIHFGCFNPFIHSPRPSNPSDPRAPRGHSSETSRAFSCRARITNPEAWLGGNQQKVGRKGWI